MEKYNDLFVDRDSIAKEFNVAVDDVPTDDELIYANYSYESYSGDAFVVFKRDGKLYEVSGGHCSCYGLEGQWEPEETTVEALAMRDDKDVAEWAKAQVGATA